MVTLDVKENSRQMVISKLSYSQMITSGLSSNPTIALNDKKNIFIQSIVKIKVIIQAKDNIKCYHKAI